ncbi:MAG: hypothetical protein GEU95_00795 [Rhizobiales bacterium]|nr:hypothetical protein [Hyphomicrobiales bacterium]
MTTDVIRFPMRRSAVIWVTNVTGQWVVLNGDHGWIHSDRAGALQDARWLSKNTGLPIRIAA